MLAYKMYKKTNLKLKLLNTKLATKILTWQLDSLLAYVCVSVSPDNKVFERITNASIPIN